MEKVVDLFGVGEANTQKLLEGGNDLSQIQQGLFIGSVAEANNKDLLKASNVTHVLTIAVALSPPYPDDFVYKVIEGLVPPSSCSLLLLELCKVVTFFCFL